MLVDEDPDRAAGVRESLPDVIIIDAESRSRNVDEHITFISRDQPRPIVMFSGDRGGETIRLAARDEETAFRHLRKFAMDRGVKMVNAAETAIAMALVAPSNSA